MNKVTQFWQKIRHEEEQLSELPTEEMIERLNHYVTEAEFKSKIELVLNDPIEMIFTADGILKHFEEVVSIVNNAPELTHFKVSAFRKALSIENYTLELDDITFSPDDFELNIDYQQRRFALTIALTRDIPDAHWEQAKNVAYLYLDHGLGEFYATTRIHSLEFVTQLPEKTMALKHFVIMQDQLWSDHLEHDGDYPSSNPDSWDWSTYELIDQQDENNRIFLMRNESANSLVGKPGFSYLIKIGVAVDEECLDLLYALEERINERLTQHQDAIHVLNHYHDGIRTMSYYATDVEILNFIVSTLNPFDEQMSIEYAFDPSWSTYLRWT